MSTDPANPRIKQAEAMKTKRTKLYYIKERHNGQSDPYYVAYGQLSATEAKRHERTLAGHNIMHGFDSECDYLERLKELRRQGERVQ